MHESEEFVRPYGELGQYLHEYRFSERHWMSPMKGFFDLGDVAALLDPELACWEVNERPEVGWDLQYHFRSTMGAILRCYHVDRDRTFALIYDKLRTHYA